MILAVVACGGPTAAATPAATSSLTAAPASTSTSTEPPPSATAAPSATTAPTEPPTETVEPSATPDPLHTACDHPYYPLRQGAQWVTKTGDGVYTSTVTTVSGDDKQADATYRIEFSTGIVQTSHFLCKDGALAYGAAAISYPDGHTGTKTPTAASGYALIAADKLVDGATWDWSLTADFSWPTYENGVFARQSEYQNVSSQTCTASGPVPITTTLGVFQAMHVDCAGQSISTSGGQSATYPFNSQIDYAPGVGPVSESLLSYEIP